MSDDRPGDPSEVERFSPRRQPGAPVHLGDDDLAVRAEARAQARLEETLDELRHCLDDSLTLVGLGRGRFTQEMVLQRAAKNLIAELAETIGRLPTSWLNAHPGVDWHAIRGMRNRVVHVYEDTDLEVVWQSLTRDFPRLRAELDIDQS